MKVNSNKIKSLILLSLVGSSTTNEQKSTNQSKLTLNSLPQIGTNFTSSKITQRDSGQNVYVAGVPVLFTFKRNDGSLLPSKKCTSGFSVVKTGGCSDYNFGFLTSTFCGFSDDEQDVRLYDPQLPLTSWDNSVTLGYLYSWCDLYNGGDCLSASDNLPNHRELEPVNLKHMPFVPKATDEGTTDLIPVTSSANPTGPGLSVCVYGAASGYRCGTLTEVGSSLTVPNPRKDWHQDTLEMKNLGKVDLGTNGLLKEDLGAPVYTETKIGERTLAQALGHVSVIENADPQHQSFYYFPIETALTQVNTISHCPCALLTYNETNSQQYDHLLAQMEIPTKK